MVALLAKLKWRLWKGGYKQKGRLIGAIIASVYCLPVVGGAVLGLGVAAYLAPKHFPAIMTIAGAVVVLGWVLTSVFATGVDETLGAGKFCLLPVRSRDLQPGLFAASFISIPALFTGLGMLGGLVATEIFLARATGAAAIAAMILAPVAVFVGYSLVVLGPRAIITASTVGGVSRRRKELTGVISIVVFIAIIYGGQLLVISEAERFASLNFEQTLVRAALLASWTPFGAPFALPFDLAAQHWVGLAGHLGVTVATVVVLWWWWGRGIAAALVTGNMNRSSTTAKTLTGSFIPRIYPSNDLGAAAARSLRYWRRDMRYKMNLFIMPIACAFLVALGYLTDNPVTSFMAAWMIVLSVMPLSNDFGYDGPAMWVNIVHGLDHKKNLMGRSIAHFTLFAPLTLILVVLLAILHGQWSLMLPLITCGLGVLFCAEGCVAMLCGLLPYGIKGPGGNAFTAGNSTSAQAFLGSLAAMFGIWVPMIPAIVLLILSVFTPWLMPIGVLVALGTGVGMLLLGWHFGAKILARREPEIFATVRNWA